MATQIKGKYIGNNEIDGSKILLLKDQSLVGTKQDGTTVDLVKLDANDKVLVKGVEVGLKSDIDQSLVDAKAYADQKITDLVNGADVALDTLKEIGDKLAEDESAVSALVSTVAANLVEAKGYTDTEVAAKLVDAKAYTDAQIAAIPAPDLAGTLQSAKDYADVQDAAKLVEAKAYTDAQIAAIPPVDLSGKADITYVDSQDAQVLVDAKAYADAQIAAIPPVDLSGKADISYVDAADLVLDGKITDVVSDVADLDGYAQDIRSDLDAAIVSLEAADSALDSRLDVLEAKPVVEFEKEEFLTADPLTHITLLHTAIEKSIMVFVGRLALHAGLDYTVSIVGGKSQLTWIGEFALGGASAIQVNEKIFVVYHYNA